MRRFLVHSIAEFFIHKRKSPLLRSTTGRTKMKVNFTTCHYSHNNNYYNYAEITLFTKKMTKITNKNIIGKKIIMRCRDDD